MQTIKVAKLSEEAKLPTRKHPQDAGLDFYSVAAMTIPAHSHAIVPTGITIEIESGFVGLLKPKGASNHLLGAGVVDAGYQGEILIKVVNPSSNELIINKGDAIGQMLILPILTPAVEEINLAEIHHSQTQRSDGGGIVSQYQTTSPSKKNEDGIL
ncbi:MAG: hypothetical protein BGO78_08500 [Chloroflexi bacterium 44-23]|nr:MAG: hypothetical protein BGO78_08500 [Chloroflexi bacterium 44-23]